MVCVAAISVQTATRSDTEDLQRKHQKTAIPSSSHHLRSLVICSGAVWKLNIYIFSIKSITYVPITLFFTSAIILGSISHAITVFATSNIFTVKFPVPGPTSSTVSVDFNADFSTIAFTTPGFFRICCPLSVLNGRAEKIEFFGGKLIFNTYTAHFQ